MVLHLILSQIDSNSSLLDLIGEFWIEYVHVGILESWIAGFGRDPGSENHLLNSIRFNMKVVES